MMYVPSNSIIERLRGLFKRRVRDSELAYLGDSHGEGARTDVPGKPGFMYIHFAVGQDENGNATYGGVTMARSGAAAYINAPGMPVHVAYNRSKELEIVGTVNAALDQYGIDTRVLNPLNQQSKFVYEWQLTYGLANAVANSITEATLITVKSFRHFVGNVFQTFATPDADAKIDVVSVIPPEGEHCFVAIWVDTYTNTHEITSSTPQPMAEPLDETDIQECAADRPPDAMPLKAFRLANAQSSVKQSSQESSLRQHMATPHLWGFPNVLTTRERVWPNRTLVTGPFTMSGAGDIDYEAGAQHIIVHKGNFDATTNPTVDDDSDDGYSVGSPWFNKSTGILRFAADVTVGAAVWEEVTGGGSSMSSFEVTGDSGTPFDIEEGDTFAFEGTGGIEVITDDTTKTVIIDGSGVAGYTGYILIQDQKAQNTPGGAFAAGAQTRVLNTIVTDTTSSVSLSTNQFTLQAGTYRATIEATSGSANNHQAWLYNVTDAVIVARGTSSNSVMSSVIKVRFTIPSAKAFEVRHQCASAGGLVGFGYQSNLGTEIYTQVELEKE